MKNSDLSRLDSRLILLAPEDNCVLLRSSLQAGARVLIEGEMIEIPNALEMGHKLARRDIAAGEKLLRYGAVIGTATQAIRRGEHVHTQNLQSDYIPELHAP